MRHGLPSGHRYLRRTSARNTWWACRCGASSGMDGSLGDSGMAYFAAGWACAVLQSEYGIHHAGAWRNGTPAIADHSFHDFAHQLCADESSGYGICRRAGISAGVRHKGALGNRFLWIAAVGLVVLTALHTIFGGMRAVLYTRCFRRRSCWDRSDPGIGIEELGDGMR